MSDLTTEVYADMCRKLLDADTQIAALQRELDAAKAEISYLCADVARLQSWEVSIKELVSQQALDHGLWFFAETAPENYLQEALRQLHARIECGQPAPKPQDDALDAKRYRWLKSRSEDYDGHVCFPEVRYRNGLQDGVAASTVDAAVDAAIDQSPPAPKSEEQG